MRARKEGAIYREGIIDRARKYHERLPHLPRKLLFTVAAGSFFVNEIKTGGYEHISHTAHALIELLLGHPDRNLL
jgi:hypothetical protein